ncbi:poly-beta-hydroxybutyrate polymerase N-terminal domain-containing protein [Polaromonas sp. P2-4]|nr:poly-beta-hydroxybutyrate polymerase N-terminal domain-containing protein [Polaromonas sp. P2-4]
MALSNFRPDGHAPAPLDLPLKLWVARLAHGISPASVTLAYSDWFSHLLVSPSKQADLGTSALRKWLLWLQYAPQSWHGECPLCVEPLPQDNRFSPSEWHAPPFSSLAQAFLQQQQWWAEAMTGVRGVSRHHEDVAAFTMRQWLDMWSPSNFVATNPQVLKETLATGATNLASGLVNWSRDALAVLTDGEPRGVEHFRPGQGVALTPGKVVFRNRLIELIQYEPATAKVNAEPVLIVPSWIMKYYILDLTPDDSLVKYLVERGHTVFMVSWKNPDGSDRDLGMDDYLEIGVMEAVKAVQAIRPRTPIHAMGYCLGGTLLAIAAAGLGRQESQSAEDGDAAGGADRFPGAGRTGAVHRRESDRVRRRPDVRGGYLDERQMAGAFQLINSKDLVWSKLVHEYLMGAHTPMTALRAWNADATRLPARMHSEYLRQLYLHNDLAEGRYHAGGQLVRLADIELPLFVVATERDHVSPWQSVYQIHRLASSPVSFVLTSGGHNVGIVNPPAGPEAHPQASYRFASHEPGKAPVQPRDWLDAAQPRAGSWWPSWHDWLRKHSSGTAHPPRINGLLFEGAPLAAPGRYVHLD